MATYQDYARAESFLPWNAAKLAFKLSVVPNWLDEVGRDERFWYRNQTRDGSEFVLVDPAAGTRRAAFDHVRLAAALSVATGEHYVHTQLPFESIELVREGQAVQFDIGERRWTCDLSTYACASEAKPAQREHEENCSPDKRWAISVREHDLWLRDTTTDEEQRLTHDGEPHNAYATLPESRLSAVTDKLTEKRLQPAGRWSPDSRNFVTHRVDERPVLEMPLIQSVRPDGGGRPVLHTYRYPLPEDEHIPMGDLFVVDVERKAVVKAAMEPLPVGDFSPFDLGAIFWTDDGGRVLVVFRDRGYRRVRLFALDPATGETRLVLEERGTTNVSPNLSPIVDKPVVWLSRDGSEALWLSERDGWGHLYLYDATTGAVKRQVTHGAWAVRELHHVDEEARVAYFTAGGRHADREPYYRHLHRVSLDRAEEPHLLTPEPADHQITVTPGKGFFLDTYSTVDAPPVTVLRALSGELVRTLEEADIEALLATGWRFPERFKAKARDGVTDIYGLIIRPTNFDPTKSYPVIDGIYPGPQVIRTPKRFPDPTNRMGGGIGFWQNQAIAELGFVVVNIDGFGTPYRSKAFVDYQYGKMEEAGGLEDHIAALRQLRASHPYLDLDRVGIYGHSGGGYASVRAMLAYPDFYKVAVSSAGNHDQRGYLADWGELYIGMLEGNNYDAQANPPLAGNLKGKLLLAWGELDDNVHPALTIRLIDALIKANKDFDLLVLPSANHGFADLSLGPRAAKTNWTANNLYFMRRRWDYFVQHLLNAGPPAGYRIREP